MPEVYCDFVVVLVSRAVSQKTMSSQPEDVTTDGKNVDAHICLQTLSKGLRPRFKRGEERKGESLFCVSGVYGSGGAIVTEAVHLLIS